MFRAVYKNGWHRGQLDSTIEGVGQHLLWVEGAYLDRVNYLVTETSNMNIKQDIRQTLHDLVSIVL